MAVVLMVLGLLAPFYEEKGEALKPPQNTVPEILIPLANPEFLEPTPSDIKLVINIPARKVVLFDNEKEVSRYDVAVGQPLYQTPEGAHIVNTLIWNPWWLPPDSPWAAGAKDTPPGPHNPLGPVKLLMDQEIRLHGTNADGSVGKYSSHGCLRMHNDEVAKLAWYIQKKINGADDSLFEKYGKNRTTSYYVQLDSPVNVEIIYRPIEVRDDTLFIHHDAYLWRKNIVPQIINALIENDINLSEINLKKIEALTYPAKRYDITAVDIHTLLL